MDSNIAEILMRILTSLFYIVPTLFFIGIAIYYLMKVGSKTEGMLMLIGNILILLVSISFNFMFLYIESWGIQMYSIINTIVNGIGFIGSTLFAIGVFMIVRKVIRNNSVAS
ncbi:hypothetical protein [Aquimarina sp. 2201CG5-10]|uniref:hypothetical protein n=1 Tax=Aquimarina callyspongiae TaxID=3098150 RepID=UPI002AB40CDF|nr:hypothetical protein [Aquimarina sp. 2201CG5-10]MDY8138881.1 hypothetical protein [Aquimarina sp. 2201CG5-10]